MKIKYKNKEYVIPKPFDQCFLTQVNNGTLPKGRNYFATMDLLEQWKHRRYKKEWRLNDKKIVHEHFKLWG